MLRKALLLINLFFITLVVHPQPGNLIEVLSQVKSVPFWYTKEYRTNEIGRNLKVVDSSYKVITKMDSNVIMQLMFLLSDSTDTGIPNSCNGEVFSYGQLAFLLINDIEPVPFFLLTKSQWDAWGQCGILPIGFLDYIKKNAKEFENKYRMYFHSKERKNWLRQIGQGKWKVSEKD